MALAMELCKLNECPFGLLRDYQSNAHFISSLILSQVFQILRQFFFF